MVERLFTLDEAKQLLPELRQLFQEANNDLDLALAQVQNANELYSQKESEMNSCIANPDNESELNEFRKRRAEFQDAIQELSREQSEFLKRLTYWVDKITDQGIILRSLREGLVDFPAEENGFRFLLCWQVDETDITHWHLTNDGFVGRKPLVALSEYF